MVYKRVREKYKHKTGKHKIARPINVKQLVQIPCGLHRFASNFTNIIRLYKKSSWILIAQIMSREIVLFLLLLNAGIAEC